MACISMLVLTYRQHQTFLTAEVTSYSLGLLITTFI